MMWICHGREIAGPTGATISGTRIAGGAQVHIDVAFRLVEWPWAEKGPISLVPQPSEIIARTGRGELCLGYAFPDPEKLVSPPSHSFATSVRFTLQLSTPALVALEAARDGGPLELEMTLVAHPLAIARCEGYAPGLNVQPTTIKYPHKVPREQWLALLKSVGYCDTLLTELRLPTTGVSAEHLARAVEARNEGRYGDAIAACRVAIERLDSAPKESSGELDRIVRAKRADLADRERFVLLRTATQVFASPVHHGATHYQREDAELAIATTAALLRLAPRWGTEPKEEE
jgi:hypothetical protein